MSHISLGETSSRLDIQFALLGEAIPESFEDQSDCCRVGVVPHNPNPPDLASSGTQSTSNF